MPAASPTETTREGLFTSTRWTMVLDAGQSQTPPDDALRALSELCRIYWRPIFLFLRRQGSNPDDAQDLTQGFFAHLIESRAYARADPDKGRFRSFLLGALKHFVAHARAHERTQKRGGGMAAGAHLFALAPPVRLAAHRSAIPKTPGTRFFRVETRDKLQVIIL